MRERSVRQRELAAELMRDLIKPSQDWLERMRPPPDMDEKESVLHACDVVVATWAAGMMCTALAMYATTLVDDREIVIDGLRHRFEEDFEKILDVVLASQGMPTSDESVH